MSVGWILQVIRMRFPRALSVGICPSRFRNVLSHKGWERERFNLVNGISFLLLFDNNQNICFRIDSHNSPLSAADDEIIIILTVVVMYF